MIDNEIKENEMTENNEIITTDTEGIYMRDYQDTLVTRDIPVNYGYYNDAGEYVENGTLTITHYRYAHNPTELYEANANQPYFDLDNLTTQTHNFKSKVLEWAQKEKMNISFSVEKTSNSNRFSQFKSILKVNGKNISIGYGKSKKNAEKDASRVAYEKLQLNGN